MVSTGPLPTHGNHPLFGTPDGMAKSFQAPCDDCQPGRAFLSKMGETGEAVKQCRGFYEVPQSRGEAHEDVRAPGTKFELRALERERTREQVPDRDPPEV